MPKDDYDDRCLVALAETRAYINKYGPYFSSIVYGLIPRFIRGLGTLGVTKGLVLIVDPVWYVDMEKEVPGDGTDKHEAAVAMRGGVTAHEVMHVLRGIERLEAMPSKDLANIAFDLPINHDLSVAKTPDGKEMWPLPKWALYPSTFNFKEGLTGEQYYELLQKNQKKLIKQGLLGDPSDDGSGDGSRGSSGSSNSRRTGSGGSSHGTGGKDSSKTQQRKVAGGRCGGCAGGHIDKELEDKLDEEVGRNKADVQRIRKETMRAVREAINAGCGTVPGSLQEWLDMPEEKSTIPWRTRLAQIIRRASGRVVCGQADFSMKRPSKRSYTRGVIRPGMIDRRVEVAFIEDSSGSMGAEQLKAARVEAVGVFEQLSISDAWFMDADTETAAPPQRVRLNQIASLPVHGRGGTDFRPAIEMVQKLRPKPDIVIYLTDGDGPAPEHAPKGVEIVWCIVPTPWGRRPANWGHLVVVSDDQALNEPYAVDEW